MLNNDEMQALKWISERKLNYVYHSNTLRQKGLIQKVGFHHMGYWVLTEKGQQALQG